MNHRKRTLTVFLASALVLVGGYGAIWWVWSDATTSESADELFEEYLAAHARGELALAASHLTRLLKTDSSSVIYAIRAKVYQDMGELDEAVSDVTAAIDRHPESGTEQQSKILANYYYSRAILYVRLSKADLAMADLTRTIAANPEHWIALGERARLKVNAGDDAGAIVDTTLSLEIQEDALQYQLRGLANNRLARYKAALADYEKALSTWNSGAVTYDPEQSGFFYASLASFLAMCPDSEFRDGNRALQLAKTACEQSDWQDAAYLSTLAAAYAENGDFETAIKWQESAIEKSEKGPVLDWHRRRLSLLRDGKPLREHGEAIDYARLHSR